MSTAARKARKRLINNPETPVLDRELLRLMNQKPEKIGTPLKERSWWTAEFPGVKGTRYALEIVQRSAKKRAKALADRGLTD